MFNLMALGTKARLILALLLACYVPAVFEAQDVRSCTYVVRQVAFENPTGLTAEQLAKLRIVVMGRCYDPVKAVFVSGYVYDQLRLWGYPKATVYEPKRFVVLDQTAHPAPIAVAIDFRLRGSDAHAK